MIGVVLETAAPFDTPRRMAELVAWLEEKRRERRLAVKVEREKGALADLTELAVKVLDYTRDQGRVTSRAMVREVGASPNTLRATFSALIAKGLLVRHGAGRGTWYGLP